MRLEITNRSGYSLVTAGNAEFRSVAIDESPVVMDSEAWAHTLVCAPSIGRMVERGEIVVRQVDANPSPGPDSYPAPTLPAVEDSPVDSAGASAPETAETEPAPVVEPLRQSGGGKRRR